jgi:hypothetical protein
MRQWFNAIHEGCISILKYAASTCLCPADREAWFYTINVSRRPKLRRDASNADMADNRVAGNGKSLNLNHGELLK